VVPVCKRSSRFLPFSWALRSRSIRPQLRISATLKRKVKGSSQNLRWQQPTACDFGSQNSGTSYKSRSSCILGINQGSVPEHDRSCVVSLHYVRSRSTYQPVYLWNIYIFLHIPIWSMYGIFTYIWVIFRANVGTYSIHGAYGIVQICSNSFK